jgi:hypothetical protein
MIDVQIQPFGRTLMSMALGVLKYQANVKAKNIEGFKKELKNIQEIKTNRDMMTEISFDMTSRLLDKRFTTSKEYIKSGGIGEKQFKKSTSEQEKVLQYITEKNMLKARVRFNSAVSAHNQNITDQKIKNSFKKIQI